MAVHDSNNVSVVDATFGQNVTQVNDGGPVDLVDKDVASADASIDQDRAVRMADQEGIDRSLSGCDRLRVAVWKDDFGQGKAFD